MARPVIGIHVQTRRIAIHARGELGVATCRDTDECCEDEVTGTGTGAVGCCDEDDVALTLNVIASGPVGAANILCEYEGIISLVTADLLVWEGQGSTLDCLQLYLLVYCLEDAEGEGHYYGSGEWRGEDGSGLHKFEGEFTVDGGAISLELVVPGQDEPLIIAVDHPCEEGTGTGTGVTGPAINCVGIETTAPTVLTVLFHDCTGDMAVLNSTSVVIIYDGLLYWKPAALPAGFTRFRMSVVHPGDGGSNPTFQFEFLGCFDFSNGIGPLTCEPFVLPGGGTVSGTCGAGDVEYTVTE